MKFTFSKKAEGSAHASMVSKGKSLLHHVGRDAYADWALIVAAAALTALFLIAIGVAAYFDMERRLSERAAVAPVPIAASVDGAALERILNDFDFRAARYSAAQQAFTAVPDPSR